MTRQLLSRSRSQLCAELEYDIWNFCSLNPFRLNQGLKTLFRITFDRRFIIREDRFGSAFSKADKRLAKLFLKRRSYFGNMIIMKRKLRFFFGYITKTELAKRVEQLMYFQRQNPHLGGFENLFRVFERRLDFLSMRLRFIFNLKEARFFILDGNMSVNGVCQNDPSFVVQLGDIVSPFSDSLRAYFYKCHYIFWYGEYISKSGPLRGRFLLNLFKYIVLRYRNDFDFSLAFHTKHIYRRMSTTLLDVFLHKENFFLSNWLKLLSTKRNVFKSVGFNKFLHRQRLLVLMDSFQQKKKIINFVNSKYFLLDSYDLKENEFNRVQFGKVNVDFLRYFYILYFLKIYSKQLQSYLRVFYIYTQFHRLYCDLQIFASSLISKKKIFKSEERFIFLLRYRLQQLVSFKLLFFFYKTLLFLPISLVSTDLSALIKNHTSLIGCFSRPNISSYIFQHKAILLSKLDFYNYKFNSIIEYLVVPPFMVTNNNNDNNIFFYAVYLTHIFKLKREQIVLNSSSFFQHLFFYLSRLEQISWGFFLVVFRDSILYNPLQNVSVRTVFFSYRNSMRLWSISQIEKMYNVFNFLEQTARKRQNFSKVKKREYSFFLIASTSYLDNYFFQKFKHFSAVNFLLFVYLRTDERENQGSLNLSDVTIQNTSTFCGFPVDLKEENNLQEDYEFEEEGEEEYRDY